jgi:uncharacterized protein (TIGR00251 family)
MKTAPSLPPYLRSQNGGVVLSLKLQPRASKDEIGEPLGDELRIKVTAPPVDSAANEALLRLLAAVLDCGRNRIELVRGQTSRHKLVMLHGFTIDEVRKKIGAS